MPTFKRYSGIKVCEQNVQRGIVSSSGTNEVRPFWDVSGTSYNQMTNTASSGSNNTKISNNMKYLSCDSIKASADSYDASDYNGTSTGTCQFSKFAQTYGVVYQVQFTANESATIKCFKFFKNLDCFDSFGNAKNVSVLMFAIYFDEPISVTSGQILSMSINFAYDEEQVTII